MVDLAQAFSEIKSLPDSVLERELASPSGMIPGWLALGEIHERKALRATHDSATPPTQRKSMAQEYAGNLRDIVAGAGVQPPQQQLPPQGMPPQGPPQGMPPQMPPQMPQQGLPPQGIAALPQQRPQGFAGGGIVGLAGGGNIDMINYIRQAAAARNIDPEVVLRVIRHEGGLSDPFQHGLGPAPKSQLAAFGSTENSYGPLQLYISGTGAGLGDRALKAGIDPRTNWKGGIDFGLDEVRNKGWGQWYGAKAAGITGFQGVGGRPDSYPTPTAGDVTQVASDAATNAATQAGEEAASNTADTAAAMGGDPMSQLLMAQMFMGNKGQAPAAAPPSAPTQQARPVDASQFVQNPAFMQRMRSMGYA